MKTILIAITALLSIQAFAANVKFEEDHSLPMVHLNIVTDTGSVHDPVDKLGLANLSAHMLLRGTLKNSKNDFFRKLEELGGVIEVDVRNEGTVFRASVLSENLDAFLALFEETLVYPKFTAEELHKLKKEVESEILAKKSEDKYLIQYHFQKFFYGNHPYSYPLIGTRKGIANITHKDIIRFYGDHYGKDTLTLFGTGDTTQSHIGQWFEKLLDKLAALHPESKPAPRVGKPQIPSGRRALIVDKKVTQSQLLIGGVGMRPEDSGFYEVQLANHAFGGGTFTARLMTEIRVKRGWTYGTSNTFRFGSQPRHFGIYIFPKTADTVPSVKLATEMFEDFVKNGINADEYKFARDALVNNAPFNYDTPRKRLENLTSEMLSNFPDGYFKKFADRIDSVSYGSIQGALAKSFKPSDLTLVIVGDASKLKQDVAKLPGYGQPKVINYLED